MSARLPRPHAVARRLAVAGWRGASFYWRIAERLAPWSAQPVLPLGGGRALAIDRDDWVSTNAYRGLYERAELGLLPRLVRPGSTVVDVGANVGYYTAVLSGLVGPRGTVLAVEPAPWCHQRLEAVLRDGCLANVDLRRVAVGAASGTATLHLPPLGNAGAASIHHDAGGGAAVEVPVTTLDALADALPAGDVDLVKIDVEGLEPDVIAGATDLLASGRVRHLLVEVSPEFGDVQWAAALLAGWAGAVFTVEETGALRRRPVLRRLTAGDLGSMTRQRNVLLARDDVVAALGDLVR